LGGSGQGPGDLDDLLEVSLGLLVNPIDAGPGEDVVELIEEQALPGDLKLACRVTALGPDGPDLRFAQRLLGPPVRALGP